MPDLSTIYPNTVPAEGAFAGYIQGEQMNAARANNEANQRAALQDYLFKQQKNPIDLQFAQADVEHKRALTRQSGVTADATDLANQWERRTQDTKYAQFVQDSANKHDAGEIQKSLQQAQLDMLSGDPVRMKRGKMVYDMSTDVLAAKAKADAEYKKAVDVANIGAASREKVATTRGTGAARTPKTLDEQYNHFMNIYADPETSEADRVQAKAFADHVMQQIIAKANAKAPAITLDANGRPVMNPATPKPAELPPVGAQATAATKKPLNLDEYKKP